MTDSIIVTEPGITPRARFLAALLMVMPAFLYGIQNRLGVLPANAHLLPPADATGFINLAETGLQWTYGWREPLFPQLIAGVAALLGSSTESALNLVVVSASCLILPLAFIFTSSIAGLGSAVIVSYLLAFSPPHLAVIWFRERTDIYLCLLLCIWTALSRREWRIVAIAAGLATLTRITTWVTMLATLMLAFLLRAWNREEDLAQTPDPLPRTPRWGGSRRLQAALLFVLLTVPLFFYYAAHFGSPIYPQKLVLYDYYHRATTGSWFVNVTGEFDRQYEIPADFSYWNFFTSDSEAVRSISRGARRIYLPQISAEGTASFISFSHPLFLVFYYTGIAAALLTGRGRLLLACFLGYTLPFLPLAFLPELSERFFAPAVTLAYVISAYGLQQCILLLSPLTAGVRIRR